MSEFGRIYAQPRPGTPRAGIAGALVVALLMSACTTVPVTGRRALNGVSDAEVTRISLRAFEEMKSQLRVSHNREQIAQLQRVGNRIAEVVFWDIPNAQWEFVVFDSPGQVNAFAMAGGKVGIFSGIFEVAQTEDELAVVVAHEIAHVAAKHTHQKLSEEVMRKIGGGALAVSTGGGYYAYQAVMLAYGLGSGVVGLGFDRNKEREADQIGLIYMAKAGYDPRAAITLWDRMDRLKGAAGMRPPGWLSTHPSNVDRIIRLRKLMPEALEFFEQARALRIEQE